MVIFRDVRDQWRPDERFDLLKMLQGSDHVSPEKPFVLPSYAEKSAKQMVVQKSPILFWGQKGKRSNISSKIFVDDEAEETDREDSSSVTGSTSSSSEYTSSSSDAEKTLSE
jgi:hypothetical protein